MVTDWPMVSDPSGIHAAITASGSNAILIDAALTDIIVIRGLAISGSGMAGIKATNFKTLFVENCTIDNFTNQGINVEVTGDGTKTFVRDTIVRRGGVAGIEFTAARHRLGMDQPVALR